MKTIYETKATATGGRNGKVSTEDGILNLEVRMPNSMGGNGGNYTNPEQLFAAGYAACFDSALQFVARSQKLRIESQVTATVGLQSSETEGITLVAALEADIQGVDREVAQQLLEKAHATCPYSRAIHHNVNVSVTLK
ncbi:organic hydroperoxide resistance protein [Cytophagaceae bacterium DM2B3-1]|uniref:Organic hydroperoxide resistance protein n=1 Tax=Xanthocytophaga flava TaxID=3048013 RepID=A0ABT7CVZ4_9BACT|nr:organic hydroperoxide resistance protein [Xanthocytophaga flavus]MDJ1466406.1 organic hydroperoxide resistance protein [Xanthocytophaga flavus]MDJ1497912.1 organic hydroperoxide resistance protein [Xanthocytophaga flavus]